MRAGAAAIKAAIIDLDGTMLDTVPEVFAEPKEAVDDQG